MKEQIKLHGKPGIIPQKLCRDPSISATAKVVFALLTTYSEAFPGQKWLADHTPCSIPTLSLALKELEVWGWIAREYRNRRKGETTLYHVFVNGPIPLKERPQWVQDFFKEHPDGPTKRDQLKNFNLNLLTKSRLQEKDEVNRQGKDADKMNVSDIASEFQGTPSPPDPAKRNGHKIAYDELPDDFPSLLKVARTLPEKYPPYKKSPRAKKLTYHPNWYTVCQKGLDILRGARDTGTGYSIASKYLKQAFESGYTPEQWLACAKRLFELRAQGEEWAQYIQPATVNKMLPHFVANGLRGSGPRNVYRGESLAAKLREVG